MAGPETVAPGRKCRSPGSKRMVRPPGLTSVTESTRPSIWICGNSRSRNSWISSIVMIGCMFPPSRSFDRCSWDLDAGQPGAQGKRGKNRLPAVYCGKQTLHPQEQSLFGEKAMNHDRYDDDYIADILKAMKTIALLG